MRKFIFGIFGQNMDIRIIMQRVSQRFTYLENLIFDQIGKIGKGVSSPIVLISMCRRVPIFVYKTAGNEAISSGFDSTLIQGQPSDKPGALKKVNGTDAYRTIGTKRFQSRQDLKAKKNQRKGFCFFLMFFTLLTSILNELPSC